jgi:hypothetical protein
MATRKSKSSDSERLDDAHMERVISLLEPKDQSKPITKKEACQILNITYNTTRLGALIEKYKDNKARDAAKRAEKRGKPATEAEIQYAIQSYLEGETVDAISKSLYRGPTFINSILDNCGVPRRQSAHSYFKPTLIPEACMRESFKVGEKVYSARYDSLAVIEGIFKPGQYRIYLLNERHSQYAYQPAEELASLDHLRKLGVNV